MSASAPAWIYAVPARLRRVAAWRERWARRVEDLEDRRELAGMYGPEVQARVRQLHGMYCAFAGFWSGFLVGSALTHKTKSGPPHRGESSLSNPSSVSDS